MTRTYLQNRNRLTDMENRLVVARGEGIVREFGIGMYTLLYLKWITKHNIVKQLYPNKNMDNQGPTV